MAIAQENCARDLIGILGTLACPVVRRDPRDTEAHRHVLARVQREMLGIYFVHSEAKVVAHDQEVAPAKEWQASVTEDHRASRDCCTLSPYPLVLVVVGDVPTSRLRPPMHDHRILRARFGLCRQGPGLVAMRCGDVDGWQARGAEGPFPHCGSGRLRRCGQAGEGDRLPHRLHHPDLHLLHRRGGPRGMEGRVLHRGGLDAANGLLRHGHGGGLINPPVGLAGLASFTAPYLLCPIRMPDVPPGALDLLHLLPRARWGGGV
mmetsp:Transcript_83155/g.178278  ORF Transcript_83155/g.178278 Transcript_83155/m.178278 type:complete len:262 (-) Transcript_83155:481-1266(-)